MPGNDILFGRPTGPPGGGAAPISRGGTGNDVLLAERGADTYVSTRDG
jgi:hypothetical protein